MRFPPEGDDGEGEQRYCLSSAVGRAVHEDRADPQPQNRQCAPCVYRKPHPAMISIMQMEFPVPAPEFLVPPE